MDEGEDRLAAQLEETRDEEGEWGTEAVEIDVRPTRMQVVSFRMPAEELDDVVAAAKAAGESLSEFIRSSIAFRLAPEAFAGPFAAIESGVSFGLLNVQIARAPAGSGRNEASEVNAIEAVAQGLAS
jgi:hypothetical protein